MDLKGSPANHTITLMDQIITFELSPYEWSQNLLCIALHDKLVLGTVRFPEESENDGFKWQQLKDIHHECLPRCVAFAPETSLVVIPKVVILATASSDNKIRIFKTDLDDNKKNDTVQILKGHRSQVNHVSWDPDGEFLASCSDDKTCQLWECAEGYKKGPTFEFESAVMVSKWHPEEPGHLLIAEKSGALYIYNVRAKTSILTVQTDTNPLTHMDWSLNNSSYVAAMATGIMYLWDLQNSNWPMETNAMHNECGHVVKFSPRSDNIVASIGRPNATLKVMHLKNKLPQIESKLIIYGGLCWHYQLPYVVAASDTKLNFWKIAF
ncbi:AGAP011887-PA-like protein [Anopheles sinensis]|uniref:Nucleoporin Nup37 n=1 Tax=Anopheles sinensis TaxID=74873 RepID=A0A084WIP0_ANOSI|nr:AGAP011887-PA-like protein [Anopheles sinensis]